MTKLFCCLASPVRVLKEREQRALKNHVIASDRLVARQSRVIRMNAGSCDSGLPRRFAPRNDEKEAHVPFVPSPLVQDELK